MPRMCFICVMRGGSVTFRTAKRGIRTAEPYAITRLHGEPVARLFFVTDEEKVEAESLTPHQ